MGSHIILVAVLLPIYTVVPTLTVFMPREKLLVQDSMVLIDWQVLVYWKDLSLAPVLRITLELIHLLLITSMQTPLHIILFQIILIRPLPYSPNYVKLCGITLALYVLPLELIPPYEH